MRTKSATDPVSKPKSVLYSGDKGHLSESRKLGLSYSWRCTSSAALICHQARAVTTELLLHHRLFCHHNQQAGVAPGICTQTLQQATSAMGHQSWPTAHGVRDRTPPRHVVMPYIQAG